MSGVERLRVELGARSYDIHVGSGVLAGAGATMAPLLRHRRVFVVTDATVAGLHLAALERALAGADIDCEALVVPSGEQSKDFAHLQRLVDGLLAARVERGDAVAALGGGVVGDLAGFTAAIVLRGLDYVQVPTTLLAQVDSSVGGKTGINTAHGKNLVGAFHQPRLVLCDTEVLSTLPRRELLAGYAEVVKYGLIADGRFFTWLESHGQGVVEGEPEARRHAVLASCRAKADIVAADEREAGPRALLNLGHTFAHALEAECGYAAELLHGEAVVIGMVLACELSAELGYLGLEEAARVRRHLAAVGLPTDLSAVSGRRWDPRVLMEHMHRDKKVRDGRIGFVLLRGIGEAFVSHEVPPAAVEALLTNAIAA